MILQRWPSQVNEKGNNNAKSNEEKLEKYFDYLKNNLTLCILVGSVDMCTDVHRSRNRTLTTMAMIEFECCFLKHRIYFPLLFFLCSGIRLAPCSAHMRRFWSSVEFTNIFGASGSTVYFIFMPPRVQFRDEQNERWRENKRSHIYIYIFLFLCYFSSRNVMALQNRDGSVWKWLSDKHSEHTDTRDWQIRTRRFCFCDSNDNDDLIRHRKFYAKYL